MAQGVALGTACYPDPQTAASVFCSGVSGLTGGGYVSCSGVSSVGSSGFSWSRSLLNQDGQSSTVMVQQPFAVCETYSFEYWTPAIAAFVAAMILVRSGRLLYRVFGTDKDN